jgi:pilus assembly protein CpaB
VPRFRRPRYPVLALRRVLAGLLAGAALVLALRTPPQPGSAGPPTVPVVVAAADLSPGVVLAAGDLAVVRLPADAAPAGRSADPRGVLGRVLAAGVRAREPLTDARLVGAGLAARLPAGQVAAPVRLADLAVAQLVSAGDRVDVLATAPDATRAELVTSGALVLATPARSGSSGGETGVLLVAVDPGTAARLAAASTTSTVTVSLAPS